MGSTTSIAEQPLEPPNTQDNITDRSGDDTYNEYFQAVNERYPQATGAIAAVIVIFIVWLAIKVCQNTRYTFTAKNTTIVPPSTFKAGSTDVREWLEKFELYAEAQRIHDKHEKGKALLSRLDEDALRLIKVIRNERDSKPRLFRIFSKSTDNVTYDYPSMVEFMLELFDTVQHASIDYMEQFTNLKQDNLSIAYYYAKVLELGDLAFPDANSNVRANYIKNQFIKGLNNRGVVNQLRNEDTSKMSICEVKDLAKRYQNAYSNYVEKSSFKPTLNS